jgi:hypothetical protein
MPALVAAVMGVMVLTSSWAVADDAPKPKISGIAQEAQTLVATADFGQQAPATVAWQWRRCPADNNKPCAPIPGATTNRYQVVAADIGFRLRVRLTVFEQDGGSDQETSDPTAVVIRAPVPTPPPAPPPAPPPVEPSPTPVPVEPAATPVPVEPAASPPALVSPRLLHPFPVIRIRGTLTRTGARVTLLKVRAPKGVRVAVRCRGGGCPVRRLAVAASGTRLRRFERALRAGTRLVIKVTKLGYIGKWSTITIRRGRAPTRSDRCVFPGERRPVRCPAR